MLPATCGENAGITGYSIRPGACATASATVTSKVAVVTPPLPSSAVSSTRAAPGATPSSRTALLSTAAACATSGDCEMAVSTTGSPSASVMVSWTTICSPTANDCGCTGATC